MLGWMRRQGTGLCTKPPNVKFSELWATVSVVSCASQPAWKAAAVSQPSKVEQHNLQCRASDHLLLLRIDPHSGVISRESGNSGALPHKSPHGQGETQSCSPL